MRSKIEPIERLGISPAVSTGAFQVVSPENHGQQTIKKSDHREIAPISEGMFCVIFRLSFIEMQLEKRSKESD